MASKIEYVGLTQLGLRMYFASRQPVNVDMLKSFVTSSDIPRRPKKKKNLCFTFNMGQGIKNIPIIQRSV